RERVRRVVQGYREDVLRYGRQRGATVEGVSPGGHSMDPARTPSFVTTRPSKSTFSIDVACGPSPSASGRFFVKSTINDRLTRRRRRSRGARRLLTEWVTSVSKPERRF